jgi:hypothetical protein
MKNFVRNHKRTLIGVVAAAVVLGANVPPAWAFIAKYEHYQLINSQDYKAAYGHWDVIDLPSDMRVNAIHTALLDTGKLLIVAGSGNDETQFNAGTFKTLIYDPSTGQTKLVPTPTDLFCSGHAFLPDGRLLIAGGTQRYEILATKVTKASGSITVFNPSPNGGAQNFPKGTEFIAPDGRKYRNDTAFSVKPAAKIVGRKGAVTVVPSQEPVFVESEDNGTAGVTTTAKINYSIAGLPAGSQVYGMSSVKMTMDKQEYQGRKESYEFDPVSEQYVRVQDMNQKRWYPTLTGLSNGDVLAISGIDGSGQGPTSNAEIFDPKTATWTRRPELDRYFPTYPSLFQTEQPNTLFYSGSNSGYGPATKGRAPGFWNLADNSFTTVPGLRDTNQMETSGSTWVGPVQNQKIMVVGGGGVGDSQLSTTRIDMIDLNSPNPRFTPGPDLPEGTRYPSLVTLPDDTTLITGGSRGYRGNGQSDNHNARIYHSDTNTLSYAADPQVGRDYHSEALLLPDGRVITLGSNPQYTDAKDTIFAPFEQRIEIYTPPYLFHGGRPTITGGPASVARGATATFDTPNANDIKTARLIRPSAATHVTNLEQRSIALDITRDANSITFTLPTEATLVPPGMYMLFVTNQAGVPSVARWVQVP